MNGLRPVLSSVLQNFPKRLQAVHSYPEAVALIQSSDVTDSRIALPVQQIGNHLLVTGVEIHLHLIKLIAVLIGIDKDNGEGKGAEKIKLSVTEFSEGNHAVHITGFAEGQPYKGYLILIRHHLNDAGQT